MVVWLSGGSVLESQAPTVFQKWGAIQDEQVVHSAWTWLQLNHRLTWTLSLTLVPPSLGSDQEEECDIHHGCDLKQFCFMCITS